MMPKMLWNGSEPVALKNPLPRKNYLPCESNLVDDMKSLVHLGLMLLLLSSGSNQAQTPAVRFEHLSSRQGLSNNFISSITQDQQGFLWFGTADGLNRFDGYEFTAF